MTITTKEQLIKKIHKIGEQKIEQGFLIKQLALSIKHYKEQRTLIEWRIYVNKVLELEGIVEKD